LRQLVIQLARLVDLPLRGKSDAGVGERFNYQGLWQLNAAMAIPAAVAARAGFERTVDNALPKNMAPMPRY
jgi:hypothetical protein